MRRTITILSFLIIVTACERKTGRDAKIHRSTTAGIISVTVDTLPVSVNGRLTKVVLFRNNFYAMFETSRKNTSGTYKKMIVFNQKVTFIEDVLLPAPVQDFIYYDLFVNHDSLYIKDSQFDEPNFVLGEYVADFSEVDKKDFPFYEDSTYSIYSDCNGEFGGTIYFLDKHTGKAYESAATCVSMVTKTTDGYYITNYLDHMGGGSSVLKIADPRGLQESNFNLHTHFGSRYEKGVELLFDTTSMRIDASFIVGSKLTVPILANGGIKNWKRYIPSILNFRHSSASKCRVTK